MTVEGWQVSWPPKAQPERPGQESHREIVFPERHLLRWLSDGLVVVVPLPRAREQHLMPDVPEPPLVPLVIGAVQKVEEQRQQLGEVQTVELQQEVLGCACCMVVAEQEDMMAVAAPGQRACLQQV